MTSDKEVRFTIIGLGNIMEVIWPCLQQTFGGPDLSRRALATTADAADLERKRERFGIPVRLEDNLAALRENRPHIIFFAPPPKVAPGMIAGELAEYLAWTRREGAPVPEIYALPPMPPGQAYRAALGEDVLVVNLIPNNVTRIAGRPVEGEGYYVCTFPAPWPRESRERLDRLFASQGAQVEIAPDELIPMLGGSCTIFSLWQVVPVLAEMLGAAGRAVGHNALGRALRAACQGLSGPDSAGGEVAPGRDLPTGQADLVEAVARSWREGVSAYYRDLAFPAPAAGTIVDRGLDLILHTVAEEPREVLDGHAIGAATKGGVLEKAIATFHGLTKPILARAIAGLASGGDGAWRGELTEGVRQTCHIVHRHGLTLAG